MTLTSTELVNALKPVTRAKEEACAEAGASGVVAHRLDPRVATTLSLICRDGPISGNIIPMEDGAGQCVGLHLLFISSVKVST